MLQAAIDAIRQEKFAQAKEILTKLLRSDQNNPLYWVWMSATMETQKERLYCLQTAYKLDPTDATARRGLIMMGALQPDDSITPFPMNHPRPWENKLKLADEKPKEKGIKRLTNNPVFRLAVIFGMGFAVIAAAVIGLGALIMNRPVATQAAFGGTARPTVTPYTNANAPIVKATLPPLAKLLDATYTPTVVYAATPHLGASGDSYKGAIRAFNNGRWDDVIIMMEQVATAEPGSADTMYFSGEARRLAKRYSEAIDFYNQAIKINPNYAPSYLGRALANLGINPKKDVIKDLSKAIDIDPNYAEAYLERAYYYVRHSDYVTAQADIEAADTLNPGSPVIKVALARIYLAQDKNEEALEAAKKANELDVTMLEGYLVLGMAYRANGEIDKAVEVLETYVQYQPDNGEAFMVLGAAYFNRNDRETARKHLEQAIRLDKTSSEAYYWLGELYLLEKDYPKAVDNLEKSVQYSAASFRNNEALSRAYIGNKQYGEAYIVISRVEKLADTEIKRAKFLYIRAIANQALSQPKAAFKDWTELLTLSEEALTEDMRAEAEKQLDNLRTPTKVPDTATPSKTPTPNVSPTPSDTPEPLATRQPSVTPKATNTRAPTATPTP